MIEQTLVILKPDAVERKLIGEIIHRFESGGLKVKKLEFLNVSRKLLAEHYPEDPDYMISLGKKSERAGDKIDNYLKQGRMIVTGLRAYLTSGPVVVMVLEGENAIALVRQITGYTDPASAEKGSIRGDFADDSILEANREGRPVKNLVHASGNSEEASKEIKLWFPGD